MTFDARAYAKEYREKNKDKIREYQRAWRAKNRETLKAKRVKRYVENHEYERERQRAWRLKNRDRINAELRAKRLHQQYGLTRAQFDELSESQDNACAICGSEETLVVDHCHDSEQVRGLLCRRCNCGLGFFRDQPNLLSSAAEYLHERKIVQALRDELDAKDAA